MERESRSGHRGTPLESAPSTSQGSPSLPLNSDTGESSLAAGGSQGGASTRAGCPAIVREETLIASEAVAFHRGRTGRLHRWIRAWMVVAGAYKREGDMASAKRCDDNAIKLMSFERAALRAAAVPS
jgi:hypothetical protein